ncbi:MAG: carbon storage regulator [Planctomycetaceae bacterium]|nr:carbon storage regulator [Planctomycetales bacterium]MCB9941057.1 carbon storage regulator [Planctomycetaceae bacterium]
MLVLTRKTQEQIHIGNNITISILKLKGNTVRIGIEAPRDIRVLRGELPTFDGSFEVEMTESDDSATMASSDAQIASDSERSEEDATISETEWEFLKKISSRRQSCLPVRRCSSKQSSGAPLAKLVRDAKLAVSPVLIND